jgi:hypothetical protein
MYGIRDVEVLRDLMIKVPTVSMALSLVEAWNVPISWALHNT